jgi:acetyl-CoA carboxylase biotin carboxyl carrier protein
MSASGVLELGLATEGGRQRLVAPAVGLLTCARAQGEVLVEGEECGTLLVLGRAFALVAPPGISGRIANAAPERLHAPLGFGDLVYELEPLGASVAAGPAAPAASASASGLVLRSPQTGRFYHRSSPSDPPFAKAGDLLGEGSPVGLIEVMKTFTHVTYRAASGLPANARVLRYLVADGADVKQGAALLELERA